MTMACFFVLKARGVTLGWAAPCMAAAPIGVADEEATVKRFGVPERRYISSVHLPFLLFKCHFMQGITLLTHKSMLWPHPSHIVILL